MLTLLMWIWALYRELVGFREKRPSTSMDINLNNNGDRLTPSPVPIDSHLNGHALSPRADLDEATSPGVDSSSVAQLSSIGSPDDGGPSYHRMTKSRENSDFSTVSGFTSSSACSGSATTTGSYGSAPSGGDEPHRRYIGCRFCCWFYD